MTEESGTATLERVEDTVALGARLGAQLRAGDVVVLTGPLGAGKTVLAKGIAAAMEVDGPVTSPTYVLARVHPPRRPGAPAMIHVDVYRLLDHSATDLLGELDSLDLDTDLRTRSSWWSGARAWPNASPSGTSTSGSSESATPTPGLRRGSGAERELCSGT